MRAMPRIFSGAALPMLAAGALVVLAETPTERPIVLRGVHVLPMDGESVLRQRDVLLRGERILSLDAAQDEIPAEATVIDAGGKYLLPGLFDTHIHLNTDERDEHLVLYLANGVTTVQSMHGSPERLALCERVANGEVLGPRVLTTGPTTAREGVDTPEKAERLVREQKAAGYDAIKMYGDGGDGMTRETYARLIAAAHAAGMRVVGHAPRNMPFEVVLQEGQDSIDHMEEIIYTHEPIVAALHPLIDVQFGRIDFDDAARKAIDEFPGVEQRVKPEMLTELARQARAAGLAVTPTLVAFETIWKQTTDAYPVLLQSPQLRYMSPLTRLAWGPDRNRYRRSWADRLEPVSRILDAGLETQKRLARALRDAGVPVMTGTDAPLTFVYPGFALHRELELLVECGFTPYEALRAATVVPARELGLEAIVGTIAPGKVADLLLLDADPFADVRNARRIAGVFVRGRWLSRRDLEDRLGALTAAYEPLAAAVERLGQPLREKDPDGLVRLYQQLELQDAGLDRLVENAVNDLGYERLNDGEVEQAVAAFRLNAETFPRSANARDSLGEAMMHRGEIEAAIGHYRKALELDPDSRNAERMLAWLEVTRRAKAEPVNHTETELRALAGDFGPRHVRYEDGELRYRRDGAGKGYRLLALTPDTFALDGLPTFRLRFVTDADGRVVKVVGHYADGRTDESPRD